MSLYTGTIMSQNLTQDEGFSYEWTIPNFKYGYAYRSPDFGSICNEFSDCFLEIKTGFFLQDRMRIFLCSSKALSGWTFTFFAEVTEGMCPLPKIQCSVLWFDLKSIVKVFEIESCRSRHTFQNRFTFRLHLKLRKNVAPAPTVSDSSISVVKTKTKTKLDVIDKKPNVTANIQISKMFNKSSSRSCFGVDVEDKFKFPLPFLDSLSDQTVSDMHYSNNKTEEDNKLLKKLIQDEIGNGEKEVPPPTLQQSSTTPLVSELFQCGQEKQEDARLVYPKELIPDFRALYTSGDMCDLEIQIGESVLRAHKLILCARSPVFKAMMEHNCFESLSSSITITDCPAALFDAFLKYLYTGELEDGTVDTAMALYSLGDKYDVPALRGACSNILHKKLSSQSVEDIADVVCDILQLADCHNNSELKDLAASFIIKHFSVVSNKPSWKDMMKSNFELTSEILAQVVNVCKKMQT